MTKNERLDLTSQLLELITVLTDEIKKDVIVDEIKFPKNKCNYYGKIGMKGNGRYYIIFNNKLLTSGLLLNTVAHEVAHITHWNHSEEHSILTEKYEQLLIDWTKGNEIKVPS